MPVPERVRLSRAKGYRLPPNTVLVSRPNICGNPFTIKGARDAGYKGTDADLRAYAVDLYRRWLNGEPSVLCGPDWPRLRRRILKRIPELRGKNLACWCPLDEPCHADVLLEKANA